MPRTARLDSPGVLHQVMIRGEDIPSGKLAVRFDEGELEVADRYSP